MCMSLCAYPRYSLTAICTQKNNGQYSHEVPITWDCAGKRVPQCLERCRHTRIASRINRVIVPDRSPHVRKKAILAGYSTDKIKRQYLVKGAKTTWYKKQPNNKKAP
eukprot:3871099-Rhodomonas_salina.1